MKTVMVSFWITLVLFFVCSEVRKRWRARRDRFWESLPEPEPSEPVKRALRDAAKPRGNFMYDDQHTVQMRLEDWGGGWPMEGWQGKDA